MTSTRDALKMRLKCLLLTRPKATGEGSWGEVNMWLLEAALFQIELADLLLKDSDARLVIN